jgi:hypothetical protein
MMQEIRDRLAAPGTFDRIGSPPGTPAVVREKMPNKHRLACAPCAARIDDDAHVFSGPLMIGDGSKHQSCAG